MGSSGLPAARRRAPRRRRPDQVVPRRDHTRVRSPLEPRGRDQMLVRLGPIGGAAAKRAGADVVAALRAGEASAALSQNLASFGFRTSIVDRSWPWRLVSGLIGCTPTVKPNRQREAERRPLAQLAV